jgi:sugar O-acyltransferase (sialic acid O-acetyltransferase NeuD family)
MKPLLIFGTGELAELAYFYFHTIAGRPVTGFTIDSNYLKENQWHQLPVIAFDHIESTHPPDAYELFIAIGSRDLNRVRAEKFFAAKNKGYTLASFVSPNASVHASHIGENCLIMDDNNIHPYVSIGHNVIFSNDNHIGHHSVIGDHCFITSNVVVGGGTQIGEGSFLGINSSIRDHLNIGKYNIIGAGALILKDTKDFNVFSVAGTPPRDVPSDRVKHRI